VQVLSRAIKQHGIDIRCALPALDGMTFVLSTEDTPTLHPNNAPPTARSAWGLPVFSMCTTPQALDVPVPDFTFAEYPGTLQVGRCRQIYCG
jgi:Glycosyl transferase family 90